MTLTSCASHNLDESTTTREELAMNEEFQAVKIYPRKRLANTIEGVCFTDSSEEILSNYYSNVEVKLVSTVSSKVQTVRSYSIVNFTFNVADNELYRITTEDRKFKTSAETI